MKHYNLENSAPKFGFRAASVLVGGILMHIALGQVYTIGNFAPYYISYIRNRTENTEVANVDVLWSGAVDSSINWLGFIIAGLLERVIGPRITSLIFSCIFSGSIALTYFCVKVSYAALLSSYGAMAGISMSAVYGLSVQTTVKWFPKRPSLASGIVLSGYGAGALVFNQVITWFINPENLSPDLETEDGERYFTDPDLLDRVPYCFLLLGAIYMGLTFIGSLCMVAPPPQQDLEIEVRNDSSTAVLNKSLHTVSATVDSSSYLDQKNFFTINEECVHGDGEKPASPNAPTKDLGNDSVRTTVLTILRTRSFYIVFLHMMLVVWAFFFLVGLYKAYGQTFISDDHFLALIGTLSSIFNSAGRPLWGLVMDRFGYKVTVRCISTGLAALLATLFLTEKMPKSGLMIWICLMFLIYCGTWAVCPSALAKLFGEKNISLAYGMIQPAMGIGSVAVLVTGTTLKNTIGWHGMFFLSGGMAFLPFFLTFAFNGVDSEGKRI